MSILDPAAKVAARELLLHEFDQVARSCLGDDPEAGGFKVLGATFNPGTGAMKPRWVNPAPGRRNYGNDSWTPERTMMLELVARTWELRSQRWNNLLGTVRPPDGDWTEQLAERWQGRFDCELSVGAGWADLITAVSEWIDESGESVTFVQVKEKFGTLRLYYNGGGNRAFDVTTTAEHFVSCRLCEVCGAPGRTIDGHWLRTLCDLHKAG